MAFEHPPDYPESPEMVDAVPVSRTWLVAGVVGVVALLVGAAAGYFMALYAFNRGVDEAVAEAMTQVEAALQGAPAVAQAPAAEPTPLPARLDDVSADDDPALGPEDAPVTIVEFSDYR